MWKWQNILKSSDRDCRSLEDRDEFCKFPSACTESSSLLFFASSENLSLIVWDMRLHSEVLGFVILTLWSPFPVHGPMPSILVEGPFNSVQLVQFSHSVMSNSATPWTAACEASLSLTNSRSLLKLMSIESVMPSNSLILCHPLLAPLAKNCPNCQLFLTMNYLHQV